MPQKSLPPVQMSTNKPTPWWRNPTSAATLLAAVAAIALGSWVYQAQNPPSPSNTQGQAGEAAPDAVQTLLQAGKPTIIEFGANNCVSCRVLAAVPVAVGFVGGQANSPRRAWTLSLVFVVGMNIALLLMGLAAARLGLMMGTLPGPWLVVVGVVVMALAVWLWRAGSSCNIGMPSALQQHLARSGLWGSLVLGALIGTVMSPCATPALGAALAIAGSGAALGASMLWGAALLLAYGIGHSALLLLAGAMPSAASAMIARFSRWDAWLPGRRAFASVMLLAGAWWVTQGLDFPLI
ncbi:MAG: hypothetical protein AUK51_00315 [Comamonadaceae bacterium CG2_30_59_20]|nr:MAG: hypothetical protein AUK51_00315 [Comamonadaceae bacterium CG2_30_59_20]